MLRELASMVEWGPDSFSAHRSSGIWLPTHLHLRCCCSTAPTAINSDEETRQKGSAYTNIIAVLKWVNTASEGHKGPEGGKAHDRKPLEAYSASLESAIRRTSERGSEAERGIHACIVCTSRRATSQEGKF